MKQCVLWLLLLQLCNGDNVDYSDYHPKHIPYQSHLQSENPTPEYNALMNNLQENWQSPIAYLKKRGYMPEEVDSGPALHLKRLDARDENNYFFFEPNEQRNVKENRMCPDDGERMDGEHKKTEISLKAHNTTKSEAPQKGLMSKVRDKFLSIFSGPELDDENSDNVGGYSLESDYYSDDTDLDENSNDYEPSDRRLFTRSAPDKADVSDLLTNLTDADLRYVKSFINCFKQSKKSFEELPASASSTPKSSGNSITSSSSTSNSTKSSGTSLGPLTPTTTQQNASPSTTQKPGLSSTLPECTTMGPGGATSKTPPGQTGLGTGAKPTGTTGMSTGGTKGVSTGGTKDLSTGGTKDLSTSGSKDSTKDLTIDLDINQKNGTGEETLTERCATVIITTIPPSESPKPKPTCDTKKYDTKSKFLAHLHHMVDEVGKPPYKPLDLQKIQDVIDKSKTPPTVTMGDGKTTECAPLRLNDMSFDLEWNKMDNSPAEKNEDKSSAVDFPYFSQPLLGQSLAAKFLQDVKSYPNRNEEYLKTPYSDNFIDSQAMPWESGSPTQLSEKINMKRETASPSSGGSHSEKLSKLLSDIASLPDSEDDNYFGGEDESLKRRVKGRVRHRGRKKAKSKAKYKGGKETSYGTDLDNEPMEASDMDNGNGFNSFDEFKDIQFRVDEEDGEAISSFISSLSAPPEVFSFDVDKYLRSAKMDMEPLSSPEYEQLPNPEERTYYSFLETPAIEKESVPIIDVPSEMKQNQKRKSGGKRDLLRQYIKGVSAALNHNFPELDVKYNRENEKKAERSPAADSNLAGENLIDGSWSNLDAISNMKSRENDHFLDDFYLLNDGSLQIYDVNKYDQEVMPGDKYSSQSLELDLDLAKKFRDLYNDGKENSESADGMSDQEIMEHQNEGGEYDSMNMNIMNEY